MHMTRNHACRKVPGVRIPPSPPIPLAQGGMRTPAGGSTACGAGRGRTGACGNERSEWQSLPLRQSHLNSSVLINHGHLPCVECPIQKGLYWVWDEVALVQEDNVSLLRLHKVSRQLVAFTLVFAPPVVINYKDKTTVYRLPQTFTCKSMFVALGGCRKMDRTKMNGSRN